MPGRTFPRDLVRVAIATSGMALASRASAGGFDVPDLGTQAVGRGAAFVAKADDGTAIYYNPAGLAQQRGTHLLVNGNVYFHSFSFARIGTYPDDPQDSSTPYGNSQFPMVQNTGGPYIAPFLALTTDFGFFDRATFSVGLFTPPEIQNRTFALSSGQNPAASRYDYVQNRSSILIPTAAVGLRAFKWLDVGLSLHLAHGSFASTTVNYADASSCKSIEDFRCDAQTDLAASGNAFGATFGLKARPSETIDLGLSFRTPLTFNAAGTLDVTTPKALASTPAEPGAATYGIQLPWLVKVGGRYIGMAGTFEEYDLELDVVYEGWGSAQGNGPVITAPSLGALKNVQIVDAHHYNNTFGLRIGGAYNFDVGGGNVFTLRGGAYYDAPATAFQDTRIDWDTLAKFSGSLGAGYKVGAFQFDFGYAAVASAPRLVGSGAGTYSPANLQKGGDPVGTKDIVNEGAYRGFTHILSLGVSVALDGFFGPPRKTHYGNAWEPTYAGEGKEEEPKEKDEDAIPPDDKPVEEAPQAAPAPKPAPPPVVEAPKPPPVEEKPRVEDKPVEVTTVPSEPEPPKKKEPEPPPKKKKPEPPPKKKKPEPPPPEDDEEEPPPVEKKPPPPPPKDEKPPKKRKEWWEEA